MLGTDDTTSAMRELENGLIREFDTLAVREPWLRALCERNSGPDPDRFCQQPLGPLRTRLYRFGAAG